VGNQIITVLCCFGEKFFEFCSPLTHSPKAVLHQLEINSRIYSLSS